MAWQNNVYDRLVDWFGSRQTHLGPAHRPSPFARHPHFTRLVRQHEVHLPVRQEFSWWLAMVLTVTVGATCSGCFVVLGAATPLLAVVILGLATWAARLTSVEANSPQYQVVKTTLLSDRELARGYLYAALWKMRGWLAALLLLTPAALLGLATLAMLMLARGSVTLFIGLWWLVDLVHLLGMIPALVALGVAFGLRFSRPDLLIMLVPLCGSLLLIGGQLLMGMVFFSVVDPGEIVENRYGYVIRTPPQANPTTLFYGQIALLALLPYIVGWVSLWLGERWAR